MLKIMDVVNRLGARQCVFAWRRFFAEAFLLCSIIWTGMGIMGIGRLLSWPSIRDVITISLILSVFQILIRCDLYRTIWRYHYPILFLWIWTYAYVMRAVSGNHGVNYSDIKPYILFAVLIFSLLTFMVSIFLTTREKLSYIKWTFPWIYGFTILMLLMPPIIYVIYYQLYGSLLTPAVMVPILDTDPREASEFLIQQLGYYKIIFIVTIIAMAFGFYSIRVFHMKHENSISISTKMLRFLCIGTVFFSFYGTVHFGSHIFPFDEYVQAKDYIVEMRNASKYFGINAQNIKFDKEHLFLSESHPGTVILVIGESASRDHMSAFNSQYISRHTTPWLSKEARSSNFFLFIIVIPIIHRQLRPFLSI